MNLRHDRKLSRSLGRISLRGGVISLDGERDSCAICGRVLREAGSNTQIYINARNLAIAERAGLDIVTACATCYRHLAERNESI